MGVDVGTVVSVGISVGWEVAVLSITSVSIIITGVLVGDMSSSDEGVNEPAIYGIMQQPITIPEITTAAEALGL